MATELAIKETVLQQREKRAKRARKKLARLGNRVEHERYELEIARRLLPKATDEDSRDAWRIHVEALESVVTFTEGCIAGELAELALCDAMLAEIRADLGAEGA